MEKQNSYVQLGLKGDFNLQLLEILVKFDNNNPDSIELLYVSLGIFFKLESNIKSRVIVSYPTINGVVY